MDRIRMKASLNRWKWYWWQNWLTFALFSLLTWVVCGLIGLDNWKLRELAMHTLGSTVVWLAINIKRWHKEGKKVREEEKKRQAERTAHEIEQRRLDAFRDDLAKRTSEAFARQFNYGRIDYFFLNPCDELRSLTAQQWDRHQFIPEDKPPCHVVRLRWEDGNGDHKYYYLSSGNWSIDKMSQEAILLVDKSAGKKIFVDIDQDYDEEEERLRQILRCASKYTSVANYELDWIAMWAVPVLQEMKASCASPKLAMLRIALQLREDAATLPIITIDDYLKHDPDRK